MRTWSEVIDMEKRPYDHADTPVDSQERETFQAIQDSHEGLVRGVIWIQMWSCNRVDTPVDSQSEGVSKLSKTAMRHQSGCCKVGEKSSCNHIDIP